MPSDFVVPISLAITMGTLHLLILFGFVWQQRVFAWPVKDYADLNSTEAACRLMLFDTDAGMKFERPNVLRRVVICARYFAKQVVPLELPVVSVSTLLAVTISILLAGSASWHDWLLFKSIPVFLVKAGKMEVTLALFSVLPILVCLELILFKRLESKSIRATIASWRFFGCVSYLTSLVTICTFAVYCLLNVRGLEATSLSLLASYGLNMSMLPFIAFVYSIRIGGWLGKKRLNPADREYLMQPVVATSALAQKSDYELQEMIKCANRIGEFAIAQWMGDELLRRSEKLELYDNYTAPITVKGVNH
ncbi:MAG: hypothetical protein IPL73_23015 [Candidatus Obscuribacter sp.]|nr:hypothetical protein [Candidatus Obscuribacter sp.]